jgi:hypothetical protein
MNNRKSCSFGDLVASVYDEASRLAPGEKAAEITAKAVADLLKKSRRADLVRKLAKSRI